MNLYAGLYQSMLTWLLRTPLRRGPVYTMSMLAMGLALAFNALSVIDLLWAARLIVDPYRTGEVVRPQHYLWCVLWLSFIGNTMLARITVYEGRDRHLGKRMREFASSAVAAPAYLAGSTVLFLLTLGINLYDAS